MLFKQNNKQKQEESKNTIIYDSKIEKIAVIDTETTWTDEVMSIGVVIASTNNFAVVDKKYYIITPQYIRGGMYSSALNIKSNKGVIAKRKNSINEIIQLLNFHNVKKIFAYNASFDFRHLPELKKFYWYDIMKVAANKNLNTKIPRHLEFCKNGRLKSGYGVEQMYRMLSGNCKYSESHNAIRDAEDELKILAMLKLDLSIFETYSIINSPSKKS